MLLRQKKRAKKPLKLSAEEQTAILSKFIAFRRDPANDQFEDSLFCSENSISLDTLELLKTTDTMRKVAQAPYSDKQLRASVDHLLRKTNRILADGTRVIPVKSLEGLLNAFTNLMKQQQLIRGKPTEIIGVEELRKKTPDQLHRHLLSQLRGIGGGRN